MARPKGMPATLGEMMGADKTLTMDNLPEVLGDMMPEITMDRVGRFRLTRALQQRFGVNYRSIPGAKQILDDFDTDMKIEDIVRRQGNGIR